MRTRSFASTLPQGNTRCSEPPCAAKLHSASVGRRPPSQMQNAISTCQGMQLTPFESSALFVFSASTAAFPPLDCLTFASRPDVHQVSVPKSSMLPPSTHFSGPSIPSTSARLVGSTAFHSARHPLPVTFGCAPSPGFGAAPRRLPFVASTYARKRPAVTS